MSGTPLVEACILPYFRLLTGFDPTKISQLQHHLQPMSAEIDFAAVAGQGSSRIDRQAGEHEPSQQQ